MAIKSKEQEELERKQAEDDRLQREAAQKRADDETASRKLAGAVPRKPVDHEQAEAEARAVLANRAAGVEKKPVGITIRGGRPGPDGKHYGGEIVTHNDKKDGVTVLATFKDDQVNTGDPKDGEKAGMTDDEDSEKDRDLGILKNHALQMMEHFDSVQIFVTRQQRDDGEAVTVACNYGLGNWYARHGQIGEWWIMQDERIRERGRREDDDDE